MHLGWSLEYQFVAMSSREMMRDFARVPLWPLAGAMPGSWRHYSVVQRPWCEL
jgi:hypothetical protein